MTARAFVGEPDLGRLEVGCHVKAVALTQGADTRLAAHRLPGLEPLQVLDGPLGIVAELAEDRADPLGQDPRMKWRRFSCPNSC